MSVITKYFRDILGDDYHHFLFKRLKDEISLNLLYSSTTYEYSCFRFNMGGQTAFYTRLCSMYDPLFISNAFVHSLIWGFFKRIPKESSKIFSVKECVDELFEKEACFIENTHFVERPWFFQEKFFLRSLLVGLTLKSTSNAIDFENKHSLEELLFKHPLPPSLMTSFYESPQKKT